MFGDKKIMPMLLKENAASGQLAVIPENVRKIRNYP